MYQDRREETAVQQWAAPQVRTAPRGVPFGRNPSAHAACACVCPMLCDPLCLLPVRHVFSPCPGSRRLNVSISTRGDRCAPRCGATGAHSPPGLAPPVISERAGAQRKAAGLSVPSGCGGGRLQAPLGYPFCLKAQSPSKGAGAQQQPVMWKDDRHGDADEPRAEFDGIVHDIVL